MTWNAFHNRGEVLRTVVATAAARRDGVLPMDVPGVSENFADELDLLSALMLKWHARLSGNIERQLMREPMDLEHAVARAWRQTADETPGVREVMDHCCDHPADPGMAETLARARQREWIRLAAAAGLANDESAAAARVGRRVEDEARALEPSAAGDAERGSESPGATQLGDRPVSFVDRIKAVLAA